MITLAALRKKAENLYPEVLKAHIAGESYFPKTIRADKALSKELPNIYKELEPLIAASKERKGFGFSIQYNTVQTRKHQTQDLPAAFVFDTLEDYLRFTGKRDQYQSFVADCAMLVSNNPGLREWAMRNTKSILDNAGKWPDLLKVCEWFVKHPKPDCYIREIPAQPHTKFIEENKSILEKLLSELIGDFIYKEGNTFEERFHLRKYERLLNVRLLDERLKLYFSGVTHLGITISDLAKLNLPCRRVIIMENKASYSNIENFLTLPQLGDTIAIFGGGYSVTELKHILWLRNTEIFYWGDIDVQGFEMLSAVRGQFSQTKSILMDRDTFDQFHAFHTTGKQNTINILQHLTEQEAALYQHLKTLSNKNRLEQERIPNDYVLQYFQTT